MSRRFDRPRAQALEVEPAFGGNKFNAFDKVELVDDHGSFAVRYNNTGVVVTGNVLGAGKSEFQTHRNASPIVQWCAARGVVASVHEDDTLQIVDMTSGIASCQTHKQEKNIGKGRMKKVQALFVDSRSIYAVCSDKVYVWSRGALAHSPRSIDLKDSGPGSKIQVIINVRQNFSCVLGPNILLLGNNDVFQEWQIDEVEDKMYCRFDGRSSAHTKLKYFNIWTFFPTIISTNRDTVLLWDASRPLLSQPDDVNELPSNPYEYKEKGMVTACHQDDTFLLIGDNSGLVTARNRRNGDLLYELNRADQIAVESGGLVDFDLRNRVTVLRKIGRWVFVGTESGAVQVLDITKEKAEPSFEYRHPGGGSIRDLRISGPNVIATVAPPSGDVASSKKKKKKNTDAGEVPQVLLWSPKCHGLEFYASSQGSAETTELTALLYCSYHHIMGYLESIEKANEDVTEFSSTVERVQEVITNCIRSPRLITFLRLRSLQTALDEFETNLEKLSGTGRLVRVFTSTRLRRDLEFQNSALHRGLNEVEEFIRQRAYQLQQKASAGEVTRQMQGKMPPAAALAAASPYAASQATRTAHSEYGDFGYHPAASPGQTEYTQIEYQPTEVRARQSMISDVEGARFWMENFQNEMMVQWSTFVSSLRKRFGPAFGEKETNQFQSILDHSDTAYVSQYKFSEFLKGFGPFSQCLANVQDTLSQNWFHGFLSSRESELLMLIDAEPPGTFLIRFSKSKPGSFALAFLKERGAQHILIESCKPEGFRISDQASRGNTKLFQSLHEIVEHYRYVLKVAFISQLPAKSWFHGDLSTDEARELLVHEQTGTFLVRFSSKGCFAASFVEQLAGRPAEIKHVLIQNQGKSNYRINTGTGDVLSFPTLSELVRYYSEKGIFKYPLKTVNKV